MKKLIILFQFILPISLWGQDIGKIKSILRDELVLLDKYFDDRVFINLSDNIDTTHVIINSCNKVLNYAKSPQTNNYELIVVNVKFLNLKTQSLYKQGLLDTSNFEYVLISRLGTYYKLFGFLSTDINGIRTYINDKREFNALIKSFALTLCHNSILSSLEARKFRCLFSNNALYYNKAMNKPVNIVNKLYPQCLYQSTIIGYDWIKPIIVN